MAYIPEVHGGSYPTFSLLNSQCAELDDIESSLGAMVLLSRFFMRNVGIELPFRVRRLVALEQRRQQLEIKIAATETCLGIDD